MNEIFFASADGFQAGTSERAFRHALNRALRDAAGTTGRSDAVDVAAFQAAVDMRLDSQIPTYLKDGIGATGGGLGAGKLRHIYKEVLEEEHPIPNGLRVFATDTSVPLGAQQHEVTRVYSVGEARVWRGSGENIPSVEIAQASKVFPVRYYIAQVLWDVFEEMADNLANTGRVRRLAAVVRDVIEAFANQKVWFGDDANGIYGVLNYPWVTRLVISGPGAFSLDVDTSSLDTEQYVKSLVRFVNAPSEGSKQVFAPNRLAMGVKMYNFMAGTLLKSASQHQPISLLQRFLQAQAMIRNESQIEVCWELDDAIATGVSAVVAYRKDVSCIANVIPGGGIQTLPVVDEGWTKYVPSFMAHGGVVMRRVGDVVIGYVDTSE